MLVYYCIWSRLEVIMTTITTDPLVYWLGLPCEVGQLMRSEGHLALTQNEDRKFKRKVLLIAMKI